MRYTQPLTAEEQRIDSAMRSQKRSDRDCDSAITVYRMALRANAGVRSERLERVADLIVGCQS